MPPEVAAEGACASGRPCTPAGPPGVGSVTPLCISSGHAAKAGHRHRRRGHEAPRRGRRRGSRGAPPGPPDCGAGATGRRRSRSSSRRSRRCARRLRTWRRGLRDPGAGGWAPGVSRWSMHLPLDDVPFRDLMSERLGLPVVVDNDANAAVLAETASGAARGLRSRRDRGAGDRHRRRPAPRRPDLPRLTRAGSEIGHMVVDLHGPDCPGACPGRGCLEVMASGTAIGREGLAAAQRTPASALGDGSRPDGAITAASSPSWPTTATRRRRAVLAGRAPAGRTGW